MFQTEFNGTNAQAQQIFSKLDIDSDGDISSKEFEKLFNTMDEDGEWFKFCDLNNSFEVKVYIYKKTWMYFYND